MTPNGQMTRDDFRDAIGWMYAVVNGDNAAKSTLAGACDPAGMVEAMATLFAGLILISTHGKPLTYLDFMRDHLDEMLDDGGTP